MGEINSIIITKGDTNGTHEFLRRMRMFEVRSCLGPQDRNETDSMSEMQVNVLGSRARAVTAKNQEITGVTMSKRFTDSNKWDDPFFFDLSNEHRLLWIYILDKCDHAGMFKINKRMIEFCVGIKFDRNEIEGVFKGRLQTLNDEKWFIPKFIEYQYGTLAENNRVHNSIIQILKKEGVFKGCLKGIHTLKDKDKDKDKEQDMDKEKDDVGFVIKYLNDRAGKNYKSGEANRKHIQARLNDGYTVNDCMKVIDTKRQDPHFKDNPKYLNPVTLFRKSHFDVYLNESAKDYEIKKAEAGSFDDWLAEGRKLNRIDNDQWLTSPDYKARLKKMYSDGFKWEAQ